MCDKDLKSLAEALTSWLHFEAECGRSVAFEEKCLVRPIFQWLTYKYPGRVETNVQHPVLCEKERIDFAVVGPNASEWELAIETKWLGEQSPKSGETLRRFAKDLLRLELIARNRKCERCWFLLAGRSKVLSDFWYAKNQHPDSAVRRTAVGYLLPDSRGKVGADANRYFPEKHKQDGWSLMRTILDDAGKDPSFRDVPLGRVFDLTPGLPFHGSSRGNQEMFPYLPCHEYAVIGWRIGAAQLPFIAEKKIDGCESRAPFTPSR